MTEVKDICQYTAINHYLLYRLAEDNIMSKKKIVDAVVANHVVAHVSAIRIKL